MQQHTRAIGTALLAMLVLAACGGDDRVASAADAICDAIDSEPSDVAAFEEFRLALARERRDGMDEDELYAALDERCGRAIAAISAAVDAQDAQEIDEPEPEPVDLRQIDWTNQGWPTDCTDDSEGIDASLSLERDDEVGEFLEFVAVESELAPMVFTVFLESVVYEDFSGDGNVDAAFLAECFYGNDSGNMVEVWRHDDEGERVHERLLEYSKFEGRIDELEAGNGALRIHTAEGLPDDETPHLNGYPVEVVTDWTFDGGEWVAEEVDRSDPPPVEATGLPECAAAGASPEDSARCFIAALGASDEAAAQEAAHESIVDFYMNGPGIAPPAPGATFRGCGEPRLGMRVPGGVACFWAASGSYEFIQFDVGREEGSWVIMEAGAGASGEPW